MSEHDPVTKIVTRERHEYAVAPQKSCVTGKTIHEPPASKREKVCVARRTRRIRNMPYGDFLLEPNAVTFLLMNPLAHTTILNADRCSVTIYKVYTTTLLVHVRFYAC